MPSHPIVLTAAAGASWLTSLVVVEIVLRLARSRQLYDIPNERSSHTIPTPRGGGLGIVVATLGVMTALGITGMLPWRAASGFLFAGAAIAIVSFVDDLRPLSPRVRLFVQTLAAVAMVMVYGYIELPALPGRASEAAGMLLTVVWIVGATNAFNFMDGIDGIAGSQAIVAAAGWTTVGLLTNDILLASLGMIILASSTGFLMRNWPPAKIFMGDVGSAFLGFSFAAMPLLGKQTERLFPAAVFFLWPFVFDSTYTMVRRALRRENIFAAHRSHLYQRLNQTGWSHLRVTLLYAGLACLGLAAGLALLGTNAVAAAVLLTVVFAAAFLLHALVERREARLR